MKKILSSLFLGAMALSAVAQNHVLKVSSPEASTNPWDKQVYVSIADAGLDVGVTYKITFDVKIDGTPLEFGVETVDANSEHLGIWNATAALNYIASCNAGNEWSVYEGYTDETAHEACCVHCPDKDTHTGSGPISCPNHGGECPKEEIKYATNTIYLNIGKMVGDLYIDNIKVYNTNGELLYTEDFEREDALKVVTRPGWGDHAKLGIVRDEAEVPSTTGFVKKIKKYDSKKIKRVENGKVVIENGGNKFNVAGQTVK
ncbi:MAG: hypothetical protein J5676_01365 [Bacteroidaceae bacterium]|nr:hypothetical protein [Bacteroidaceae bacterium]